MEKKANEQRFHDLAKPDDNEEAKGNKFYPIVFHNKKQETAELRLLWIKEEQQFIAEFSSRGKFNIKAKCLAWILSRVYILTDVKEI